MPGDVRSRYKALCEQLALPLHAQPWWLDAVCGAGAWDVCLSLNDQGDILGALPYVRRPWLGLPMLRMPRFTPGLHLYLREGASQETVLPELIAQLPGGVYVHQQYDWTLTDSAPFVDAGYRVQSRNTRILDLSDGADSLRRRLPARARNYLNRPWGELRLERGGEPLRLFELARQGHRAPGYEPELLERVHAVLLEREAGQLYRVSGAEGQLYAMALVAWDAGCAYFLTGAYHPGYPRSQAMRRLLWQAIEDAAERGCHSFDFQGSMDAGVDRFFSSFGAERRVYFQIRWP